jgi:hypothetical protein
MNGWTKCSPPSIGLRSRPVDDAPIAATAARTARPLRSHRALPPRAAGAHAIRAVRRPAIRTAAARRYGNRILGTLRSLTIRADRRPTSGTAAARCYGDCALRALPRRGQLCRLLAIRADRGPAIGTAALGRPGDRALRTLRRLAVRADRRPSIRTATAWARQHRRGLAGGCAGSQHQG